MRSFVSNESGMNLHIEKSVVRCEETGHMFHFPGGSPRYEGKIRTTVVGPNERHYHSRMFENQSQITDIMGRSGVLELFFKITGTCSLTSCTRTDVVVAFSYIAVFKLFLQ